ncbi:hypothetical protein [uncultured Prevotella sp.]|uniref:hypothetical protein n=1 Tax=uncultured Prevotella sp. TaxID=159272 RepID=UPI0025D2E754|nr:hypothetical protein [uncultured Prevotella sp.]
MRDDAERAARRTAGGGGERPEGTSQLQGTPRHRGPAILRGGLRGGAGHGGK